MKIREVISESILLETSADEYALHDMAEQIATVLYEDHDEIIEQLNDNGGTVNLGSIRGLIDAQLTDQALAYLSRCEFRITPVEEKGAKGRYTHNAKMITGTNYPGLGRVELNTAFWLKNWEYIDTIASTIAHELRHGLDWVKSGGGAMYSTHTGASSKYRGKQPGHTQDEYVSSPLEINARFTQAIKDIATELEAAPAHDVNQTIKKHFKARHIEKLFPDGFNDLSYRRLFNRALDYVQHVRQS